MYSLVSAHHLFLPNFFAICYCEWVWGKYDRIDLRSCCGVDCGGECEENDYKERGKKKENCCAENVELIEYASEIRAVL